MLTLPNVISLVRLALVPVFLWLLFSDRVAGAGWLLGVIGATDWVDGYLARRLDQVSELGKLLDPVADRLAVAAAVIGGLIVGVLPVWFGVALIVREALISVGAVVVVLLGGGKVEVRPLGKLATLLLYAAIAWLFIGEGTPFEPLVWAAWIVGIPGLVLYYVVGAGYLLDAKVLVANRRGEVSDVR